MTCLTHFVHVPRKGHPLFSATALTIICLMIFPVAYLPALAREVRALPGCEAPAPLLKELDAKLNSNVFDSMTYSDRVARQVELIDQFIVKYPREAEPPRRLINLTSWSRSLIPVLRDRFENQAARDPEDPLAQTLAGYSLALADPQRAVQALSGAKAKAPTFPVPYLMLADIYSYGKSIDHGAMVENILGYFNLCPTSTDPEAQRLLVKTEDKALQARVATALRTRLEKQTEVSRFTDYETLWKLEFQTHPPQEHAALRRQVTADLERMEGANHCPDAEFEAFLARGYKQSDAIPERSKAWEERLIREYPKSSEASFIDRSRWYNAHKVPEDPKDSAGWAKWEQEHKEALKTWIREFPDDFYLQNYAWANAIEHDDGLSEEDVMYIFEADLKAADRTWMTDAWAYIDAAEFLLHHKVQPRRALDTLRQAETHLAKQQREDEFNKNRTPQEEKELRDRYDWRRISIARQTLEGALQLRDTKVAQAVRAEVEGPPPTSERLTSWYWLNRAKLAAVEYRKADALAYYQLAYRTRVDPPEWWHGKVYDELGDDARGLWKELGGTDAAFEVWSKPPKAHELAEGYWEKPTKQIPEFELADLSGKTWRLKELRGKTVLINVWATWCGPCRVELPHVQKLYDRLKDSADLQVLTLSIDEDIGVVEPYLKENGYRFPVLPASGFVSNLLDSSVGIPQTWIVDSKGQWQWTQMGSGGVGDWEDAVTNKLKAVADR